MGRAMNPKGGDDRVYTPDELALKICLLYTSDAADEAYDV